MLSKKKQKKSRSRGPKKMDEGGDAANVGEEGLEALPDVPPNNVEPVKTNLYEDDFLSAETEEIELF